MAIFSGMVSDASYEIEEEICTLSIMENGWRKEANIVSWNGNEPKVDIREWSPDHTRMSRGITLIEDKGLALAKALNEYFAKEDRYDIRSFEPFKTEQIRVDILEHIGTLERITNREELWTKEINLASWNGRTPKIDVRDWNSDHERMSRGVTLTEEEARILTDCLCTRYGIEAEEEMEMQSWGAETLPSLFMINKTKTVTNWGIRFKNCDKLGQKR